MLAVYGNWYVMLDLDSLTVKSVHYSSLAEQSSVVTLTNVSCLEDADCCLIVNSSELKSQREQKAGDKRPGPGLGRGRTRSRSKH